MKMPDGNSTALRDYEARVDAREKSYELHEPRAIEILKERLLGDRPARKGESDLFTLAEHMINDSTHWLVDEEFVANLIIEHYGKDSVIGKVVTQYADKSIDEIVANAQDELEDLVSSMEEDDRG